MMMPLGEIIADYLAANEHGQPNSWKKLEAEYPDLAHELREFFDHLIAFSTQVNLVA